MGFNVKIEKVDLSVFMVRFFKNVKIRGFIGTIPPSLMSNKQVY